MRHCIHKMRTQHTLDGLVIICTLNLNVKSSLVLQIPRNIKGRCRIKFSRRVVIIEVRFREEISRKTRDLHECIDGPFQGRPPSRIIPWNPRSCACCYLKRVGAKHLPSALLASRSTGREKEREKGREQTTRGEFTPVGSKLVSSTNFK